MRGEKMRRNKAILSMLLAAALVMEPLGTAAVAHAEENDEAAVQAATEIEENADQPEETPETPDDGTGQDAGDDTGKIEEDGGQPEEEDTPAGEDTSKDEEKDSADSEKGEEDPDEAAEDSDAGDKQDGSDEQQPEEEGETDGDQADDSVDENGQGEEEDEKESVSENDMEEEKDETLEGFTEMPDDYHLTSAQMASKRELAGYLDEIMELEEGGDYAEGELVLLVDSQEEAEQVAEAYHAEIKKFEYGVLTLKLSKGDSVVKAMRAAANEDVNLPAAWPNYYVYAFGEENADITVDSDELIEVETTEYEMNALGLSDGSMEESDELSYRAAYTDEYLNSNKAQYQYHHTVIGSPYAWAEGYTGSGIKVAVLDTGVGSNSDLSSVTEVGTNATKDGEGHGTHVAGIIAAKANGQWGVGVAPNATLYACNVLPNNGTGTLDDTMTGLSAVSGQGGANLIVDVVNMSLGGVGYSADFQTIITGAYEKGVAIFAAAGNDGGNNYNYPASYEHVISVAATDQSNARASFSNYNDKVDISAPGVAIYSTDVFEGQTDEYGNKHTTYVDMSGTSMACPVAAGEAAVILSANPAALQGKTGGAKVDALLDLMQDNVVKVSGSGMGSGITDLAKALNISTVNEKPAAPDITITADGAQQKVTVTMTAQLGAEIYYTDNGKNPVYKNGEPDVNTKRYTGSFEIADRTKGDVRAIAVNEVGICSKTVKKAYTLKPYVNSIEVSGVSKVAKGKSVQLSAVVGPTYAANKKVAWEIYTPAANGEPDKKIDKNTDKTLKTGVSISASGKVAASKTAQPGVYVVKVTAKDGEGDHIPYSTTYTVTVTEAVKINSVKFGKKSLTLVRPTDATCDLKTAAGFEAKQQDGTDVAATEFIWSSNKKDIATVDSSGVVTPHKAGKAVITALANDSSGKKATCTITVQQLAEGVTVTGSSVVGKSKGNTYKAVITPTNVTNKKVTWSLSEKDAQGQWKEVDAKRAKEIGVSVNANNGKLSTTKNAVLGEYLIKAVTKDAAAKVGEKTVTVKDGLITKFTVKPVTATIYRKTNAFDVPTTTKVNVTVTGSGSADLTAYEVTSSDAKGNIVTVRNDTKNANGASEFTVTATGRATGKVTITVKATDGSNKSAKCTINVNNPATGIRIAPSGSNNECVAKGKSLQLKAVLETGNGKLSNNKVEWQLLGLDAQPVTAQTGMKISASGKVTAAKNAIDGIYVVRAITKDRTAVAIYPISVAAPTTKIVIGGLYSNAITLFPKNTSGRMKSPIVSDCKQGGYSITSSNPSVISVGILYTQTGNYMQLGTGNKAGSATITIKALDGSGKTAKYKVQVR